MHRIALNSTPKALNCVELKSTQLIYIKQLSQCNTKKVDKEYVECRLYWLQGGSLNWGEMVRGCSSRPPAQWLYI